MAEMYPNPTRVMVCRGCKAEKLIPTHGLTKEQVIARIRTFICRECVHREFNPMRKYRKPLTERARVDKDHSHRIISVANGLWVPQKRIADKGTREEDCWQDMHAPTSKEDARATIFGPK